MRAFPTSALAAGILAATGLAATSVADAARTRIVSEARLAEDWRPATGLAWSLPGFPSGIDRRDRAACVNLGFHIDARGLTSGFVELKSWSSQSPTRIPGASEIEPFVQLAAAAVSRWRFEPVGSRPHPIFTSMSFAFDGAGRDASGRIRAQCRIDDLPDFLASAGIDARKSALKRSQHEHIQNASMGCSSFSSACVLAGSDAR
jgi:hypothetical protein